jgi:hypothetical protein
VAVKFGYAPALERRFQTGVKGVRHLAKVALGGWLAPDRTYGRITLLHEQLELPYDGLKILPFGKQSWTHSFLSLFLCYITRKREGEQEAKPKK